MSSASSCLSICELLLGESASGSCVGLVGAAAEAAAPAALGATAAVPAGSALARTASGEVLPRLSATLLYLSASPSSVTAPACSLSLSLVKSAWHIESASATSSARSARPCSSQ